MKISHILFSAALIFCFTEVRSQLIDVWVLGDGEKVLRNDDSHPDRKENSAWDGKTVRLSGLYNEILGLQVITEASLQGAKSIEVSVDLPVNRKTGKAIGGSSLKYGPAGTVEVFTEHYLNVKDSTEGWWFYGSAASVPKVLTGWFPDALIPADALQGRGGFPVDIDPAPSNDKKFNGRKLQNQGFWIDIHLPRDQKSFAPGMYHSTIRVMQEGKVFREIPVEIKLLPQYLTDKNPTNIWLYNSNQVSYFPGMSKQTFDMMIKFEGHRHRMNMTGGFYVNASHFNKDSMDAYKPYLDGTAYSPANGYHGPGEGTGESIFPVGMYGGSLGETRKDVWKESDLWVDWFSKNAPSIKYFWYITDEPTPPVYPFIMERSEWVKSNPGTGKNLPVFTTSEYQEGLDKYIDIWAGYDGVNMKYLKHMRDKGGDYWFYNGVRPRTGTVILEAEPADFMVNSWIMYKYDIPQWFLWESTAWQHNQQGPKAHLQQRVFSNPMVFINDSMEFANGGGTGFYPGRMPYYPEEDRGLNQLFSSIRFKNIRRGQQDAAIMWMAEQKAGREKVMKIISKVVPKAMYDVDTKDKVYWSENGNDYDKARDELRSLLR